MIKKYLKIENYDKLPLFLLHFIGIKYKEDEISLLLQDGRFKLNYFVCGDGIIWKSLEIKSIKEWEAIKCLYTYSRSRYAKIHTSKEFGLLFTYIYTQKLPESEKRWLEVIFEIEMNKIKEDRNKLAESFNTLNKRLLQIEKIISSA